MAAPRLDVQMDARATQPLAPPANTRAPQQETRGSGMVSGPPALHPGAVRRRSVRSNAEHRSVRGWAPPCDEPAAARRASRRTPGPSLAERRSCRNRLTAADDAHTLTAREERWRPVVPTPAGAEDCRPDPRPGRRAAAVHGTMETLAKLPNLLTH